MTGSAVRTGEQRVLACEGDWPDDAFDRIRVHLDTAIVEEGYQPRPMPYRITRGLREIGCARDARQLIVQPNMQCLDDRPTARTPDLYSVFSGIAAYLSLDHIEAGHASQQFSRDRRPGRGV